MYSHTMPEFISEGVSQASVETLTHFVEPRPSQRPPADFWGAPVSQEMAAPIQDRIMLCATTTDQIFSKTIQGHYKGILEMTEGREIEPSADHFNHLLDSRAWFASVSSKHIFKSTIVDQISQKIAFERGMEQADQEMMRTAIGEAVSNGVVHGNLELTSPPMSRMEDFVAFYAEIDKRLKVPKYGDRHIVIQVCADSSGIWVIVTDEGYGYTPFIEKRTQNGTVKSGSIKSDKRRSGRGMEIIRSSSKEVRVDSQGRRLSMKF